MAVLAVLALFAALLPGSAAHASGGAAHANDGRARFVAQSRAAGLSANQAGALQAKADGYLAELGPGATQVAPDRIRMAGWELLMMVPGKAQQQVPCPYYYFCAYAYQYFGGDLIWGEVIRAKDCAEAPRWIPWSSVGSWINNQTAGTRARVNYLDGTHWYVPGAYSEQSTGMRWERVTTIDPC